MIVVNSMDCMVRYNEVRYNIGGTMNNHELAGGMVEYCEVQRGMVWLCLLAMIACEEYDDVSRCMMRH